MRRLRKSILVVLTVVALAFGQTGTELRRPTTDIDQSIFGLGCLGIHVASSPMLLARDAAGIPTGNLIRTVSSGGTGHFFAKYRVFGTWQSSSATYTALTLNVNSSSPGWAITPNGEACMAYSINAGASWTQIQCDSLGAGWAQQTFTISLSASQNLGNVKVAVCTMGFDGGEDSIVLNDVWTVGTYSTGGGGGGTGSGTSRRNPVLIF